jgi:hypothetical protein
VNSGLTSVFAPLSQISADEFRRETEVSYFGFVHGTMPRCTSCGRAVTPRSSRSGRRWANEHSAAVGVLPREARDLRLHLVPALRTNAHAAADAPADARLMQLRMFYIPADPADED